MTTASAIRYAIEKAQTFMDNNYDVWMTRHKLASEIASSARFEYIVVHSAPENLVNELFRYLTQILEIQIPMALRKHTNDGIAEGRAEGARAKQLEIAQAMLAKGLLPESVTDLTQLTPDDVTQLQASLPSS